MQNWQEEIKTFMGVKQGIILEGNVNDIYPVLGETDSTENIDEVLSSIAANNDTTPIFFDPTLGFYCDHAIYNDIDLQRSFLTTILGEDRLNKATEGRFMHDTICTYMPKADSGNGNNNAIKNAAKWVIDIATDNADDIIDPNNSVYKNILFVIKLSSRLADLNDSKTDLTHEFIYFMRAMDSQKPLKSGRCHTLIYVVDKINDLPTWFYYNNPYIRAINIGKPDLETRKTYLKEINPKLVDDDLFAGETEGFGLAEISQISKLINGENTPEDAILLYRYGIRQTPWEQFDNRTIERVSEILSRRVIGQDKAIKEVIKSVAMAIKGLNSLFSKSNRAPKGVLWLGGPTGVGKTETARSLAEALFGDENTMIRFDMAEYAEAHSDQKLFGAPPGYVGYDAGGQLTNAIKEHPFSILLFDEIEKAHPRILDKFLSVLEDGRMTDGQGNTVYFSECLIIFTSNLGTVEAQRKETTSLLLTDEVEYVSTVKPEDTPETVEYTIKKKIKEYFYRISRPELYNRIGENNFIVYQFISVENCKNILEQKLDQINNRLKDRCITIKVSDEAKDCLIKTCVTNRENGGRGIQKILEHDYCGALSDYLVNNDIPSSGCTLSAVLKKNKIVFTMK